MYKSFIFLCCITLGLPSILIAEEKDPRLQIREDFSINSFNPEIPGHQVIGNAKQNILKRFGYPENVITRIGADSREAGSDRETIRWEYDGLTIIMYAPLIGKYSTEWIEKIILTGSQYKLKHDLNIGSTKADYRKILGNPREKNHNSFTYREGRYTNIKGVDFFTGVDVIIEFNNQNKSEKITWVYGGD